MTGLQHRYMVRNLAVPTSAFSPSDLPGLAAWYDASNAASITSSGGAVSQWNDLSGNGWHLTQGTGSNQPTTGTRTVNGLNTLDFDGGDFLSSSASFVLNQPDTLFIVATTDFGSANQWITDGLAGRQLLCVHSDYALFAGAGFAIEVAGSFALHLHSAVFNGASSQRWLDATSKGTGNPGGNNLTAGITIGGAGTGGGFDGAISELVYCSGDQSASVASMVAYTQAKWGTP